MLLCCGHIIRKGVELAFYRCAMRGKHIKQRRQCRIAALPAKRLRRSWIVDIESNLILPLRLHGILAL